MKVDPAKLLYLIAPEPLSFAVRLADRFDCDVEDIENALLPHINRRVFAKEVMGPNQRMQTAYVLSDEYKAEVLKATLAVPEAKRATAPAPLTAVPGEPRVTKPQLAVEFLKAAPGNRCTQKEMCRALGLPPSSKPYAYLSYAVKDGRLNRDGSDWILGDGQPIVSVAAVGNIVAPPKGDSPIPKAVMDTAPTAAVAEPAIEQPKPAATLDCLATVIARAPTATFRCGIWSDGILELQRAGHVVASLNREECAQVAEFLALGR